MTDEELQAVAFKAYCWGYEAGHNDTVEGMYSSPEGYPEDFDEMFQDICRAMREESNG